MVLSLRDRVRAGMGSVTEWLADRGDDIAQAKAEIEANANQFYGEAERAVRRTVSSPAAEAKWRVGSKGPTPRPQVAVSSAARGKRSWRRQIVDNADRLVSDARQGARAAAQGAGDNPLVRRLAGEASLGAGRIMGLGTGTLQAAEDFKDGAMFFGRLLDVTEPYRLPRGEAAWDDVASVAAPPLTTERGP